MNPARFSSIFLTRQSGLTRLEQNPPKRVKCRVILSYKRNLQIYPATVSKISDINNKETCKEDEEKWLMEFGDGETSSLLC